MNSIPSKFDSINRAGGEWSELIGGTPADILEAVQSVLEESQQDLQKRYRSYIENDPQIASIISTDDNREELTNAFMLWVQELVKFNSVSPEQFCETQAKIGSMMARIGYPPHAISRGLHKLTLWFVDRLAKDGLPSERLVPSLRFVVSLVNTCTEIREVSYHNDVASLARLGEAYRLHTLSLNLGMEREKQRAALLEWSHKLLLSVHSDSWSETVNRMDRSEFGLWLTHKAPLLFQQDAELDHVTIGAKRIDDELLPALKAASAVDRGAVAEVIHLIEQELTGIRFALSSLFETHLELEKGRDQLTHLLNRRFLPPVLMREIALQRSGTGRGLCVLLVDIDHFKAVNDTHGHDAGDIALQHIASVVGGAVRPSDFTFRFGGEEFAIVLVESDLGAGEAAAERVRQRVEISTVILPSGKTLRLTVSIGLACYAGELDYEGLIRRADVALYQAKRAGRNRVEIAA